MKGDTISLILLNLDILSDAILSGLGLVSSIPFEEIATNSV